ncbi:MAG TPA: hypothetical protein VIJ23_14070 [Mycobacterium sp.]
MTTAPDRRTAQERGIRMGNRVVQDTEPRISQLISATIHLAGEQDLRVDTYGSRAQRGGHIAVASDSLLIYLHDRRSAKVYADAWIDAWYIASHLPKQVPTDPGRDPGPVMMAHARGSDDVQHVHDAARGVALIRIGRLSWLLHDQAAWATATATWRQVAKIAPLVLAPRNTDPLGPRDRHQPRQRRPAAPEMQPLCQSGNNNAGPAPGVMARGIDL